MFCCPDTINTTVDNTKKAAEEAKAQALKAAEEAKEKARQAADAAAAEAKRAASKFSRYVPIQRWYFIRANILRSIIIEPREPI